MKKSIVKTAKILAAALVSISMLAGCSAAKEEPLNQYTVKNGMYSVSLPGEWKEQDNMGMEGLISLSREDGMEAVFIGMVKGQIWGQGGKDVKSLSDFFDYMSSLFLNGEAATTELEDAESVALEGFTSTIAKDGVMTLSGGASGNVFVECGETEEAYYCFIFSASKSSAKKLDALKKVLAFEELEIPKPEVLADTLRWFNATCAVIIDLNGGDLNIVTGFEPGDLMKNTMSAMLQRDWGVSDRATMDENMEWLLTEGHNADALSYLTELGIEGMTRDEVIAAMEANAYDDEEQTIVLAALDAQAAYGDQAIAAWDLSRAMSMYGWGYLAGYYTYEEAMDKSLETAKEIQQKFSSWDDYMNSYLLGYSYWSGENLEDASSNAYERKQLYEEIKARDNSPFGVDWNAGLQKEW